MSVDVIALCHEFPDEHAIVAGLMAAGPDLRVLRVAGGAVLSLYDDADELVLSVEGSRLVMVPGEVRRLLGPDVSDRVPLWWVEARAPSTSAAGPELARRFAAELVARLGGTIWPARPQEHGALLPAAITGEAT